MRSERERISGKQIKFYQLLCLPLLFLTQLVFAQSPTQTIRGTVLDEATGTPLPAANVVLKDVEPPLFTATNEQGVFSLEAPVGYYRLEVSYLGYQTYAIPSLLVESGKEVVLDIQLEPQVYDLETTILVKPGRFRQITSPVSTQTITLEETLRFPATFFDPARLATTYAGVVNDNDQANGMAVRGNNPDAMSWRLEGVEIVNPNHLSNAGTFSDRPTRNAGGVNILSAQLLGNSYFHSGAFTAQYGNALSGILDMSLRPGNNEQYEFTTQIGLLGIDVAAEGPLKKNDRSSFLVNYRYSTIGLLTDLGVEVSDEDIRFQDLAVNFRIPTNRMGTFSIFGMGGLSENIFTAERDTGVWEMAKDRQDIEFKSEVGIVGVNHFIWLNSNVDLQTTAVLSARNNFRENLFLSDDFEEIPGDEDNWTERKLSLASRLNIRLPKTMNLQIGLMATEHQYDLFSRRFGQLETKNEADGGWLFEPYANLRIDRQRLTYNLGLHYQYFSFNSKQAIEPRASVSYRLSSKQNLSLAYGLHSQLQSPQLYLGLSALDIRPNRDLDFTRSHHFVLAYSNFIKENTRLGVEVYYQRLFDVPIMDNPESSFSALNLVDEVFFLDTLINDGTGQNYGVEVSLQRFFSNNYFYSFNATVYESKYKGGDGIERDTRFNGNYIMNLTGGKEFRWNKKGKDKIFGLNARVAYYGGFRATPIDLESSQDLGQTVFDESRAFSEQLDDYFKIDLRIYWKNNKARYSSTLALDIQNATNRENIAYTFYDPEQGEVVVKNQLGLIPILSYRAEF